MEHAPAANQRQHPGPTVAFRASRGTRVAVEHGQIGRTTHLEPCLDRPGHAGVRRERDDRSAPQVDHVRVAARDRQDFVIGAEREDRVAGPGDR